jgi:hypothetical protein
MTSFATISTRGRCIASRRSLCVARAAASAPASRETVELDDLVAVIKAVDQSALCEFNLKGDFPCELCSDVVSQAFSSAFEHIQIHGLVSISSPLSPGLSLLLQERSLNCR